jgi:hypothetical protein
MCYVSLEIGSEWLTVTHMNFSLWKIKQRKWSKTGKYEMFPELPDNKNMIGSVNLKTAVLISLEWTRCDAGHCTHVTVYTLASVHEYEPLRETDIACQRLGRGDGCLSGYSSVSRPVRFGRLVPMRFSTSNNSTQSAVVAATSWPSLFCVSCVCVVVLCYFLVFSRVLAVWKLYLLHSRICLFRIIIIIILVTNPWL